MKESEFKITLWYWDESDQTFHTGECTGSGKDWIEATDRVVKKYLSGKNVFDIHFVKAVKIKNLFPVTMPAVGS